MFRFRHWLLTLCLVPALARTGTLVCSLGPRTNAYRPRDDQRPTTDAMDLVLQMNRALAPGCTPNCPRVALLRNASAGGVLLMDVDASGQWKLVYAPKFLSEVHESYGDAAVVAMLSHAFGHAIDVTMASAWPAAFTPELRADAWSACALAQNNFSLPDVKSALAALAKYPAQSSSNWASRLPALRLGYVKCAGDGAAFDKLAK